MSGNMINRGPVRLKFEIQPTPMAHLQPSNQIQDILHTPDCLDIPGASEVQLTDSSALRATLRGAAASSAGVVAHDDGDGGTPPDVTPEVYEWRTTRLPLHEILPMKFVKPTLEALVRDVEAAKSNPATHTMSLDEFRVWLMDGDPRYKQLFQKLPRLFRMVVSSKNTPENMAHIMRLIEMRRVQEASSQTVEEKTHQVSSYFRSNFARPAAPGEEARAVANGTGYRGTPLTRDDIARDFGSS